MAQVKTSSTSLVKMEALLEVFMEQFRDLEQNPNLSDTRFVVVGDLAEISYELKNANRYLDHNVEISGTIVLLIDYEERIDSIKNTLKERWPRYFHVIDSQLHYDPVTESAMIPVYLIPLDRLGLGQDFDRECGLKNITEVGKKAPNSADGHHGATTYGSQQVRGDLERGAHHGGASGVEGSSSRRIPEKPRPEVRIR
ncbi:hypothetical protein BO82DRAFT_410078 [Aspergillus uvarum CBS 121591]|uniref:Uncharacterized protein n=1 Tax=Aspergillus uvarum CBS 121591 TaxID=1448315 RepID=A0A319D645_9EURO|nr:hypothetical protein BO82DRAFT_410078 [Aspergillus uvarum CBS 121591]PYH75492.1 hypothetical protein BO82DRAFT_410078 [Aspergillus uvarum CBS 121591]